MFAPPKRFEAHPLHMTLKECGQNYGRVQTTFRHQHAYSIGVYVLGSCIQSALCPAGLLFFDESIFEEIACVAALDHFGIGVPSPDVQLEFIFFFFYIELVSRPPPHANPFCRCLYTTRPHHISRPMATLRR